MNRLIAKLDLKDYCNNRTTLKIHLLEDGQLTYRLAATKSGMGHAMSNLQIGFKNGSRLPDHVQDIEGFLKDQNYFDAVKILAKHDENYMPPEVKEALGVK